MAASRAVEVTHQGVERDTLQGGVQHLQQGPTSGALSVRVLRPNGDVESRAYGLHEGITMGHKMLCSGGGEQGLQYSQLHAGLAVLPALGDCTDDLHATQGTAIERVLVTLLPCSMQNTAHDMLREKC